MKCIAICFIFLSICLIFAEATNRCSSITQDSVFILDGSGSISESDFKLAKESIVKVISFLKTTNPDNRMAFVVFGDDAKLVFNFEKHISLEGMIREVMHTTKNNGLTGIGKALRLAVTELLPVMRTNVQRMIVLLTDGSNTLYPSPYVYANHLKEANVQILTIGIGSAINSNELTMIASPNLVIKVASFYGLLENLRKITHHICVIVDPMPLKPCTVKAQDLVILLDSSGSISVTDYEKAKSFLEHFLNKLTIGSDKTRVAMISFSSKTRLDFDFDLLDKNKILSRIKNLKKFGSTTAIGLALRDTFTKLLPKQRQGIPFNILLMTDGFNNVHPKPLEIAHMLKKAGSTITTLGIGKNINLKELKEISSNDKVLTVESYSDLAKHLKTIVKTIVCG